MTMIELKIILFNVKIRINIEVFDSPERIKELFSILVHEYLEVDIVWHFLCFVWKKKHIDAEFDFMM